MAVPTPKGAASTMARSVMSAVATMGERMPPCRPMSRGSWNRNPEVTWGRPLMKMSKMMKTRMSKVKPVKAHSRVFIKVWTVRGGRRMGGLPPAGDQGGAEVEDHDDYKQNNAGGEQGLPVAAGGVAQLQGDVTGEGAHRVQDGGGQLQGIARHHDHRHGFAHRPAHAQDNGGHDARRGRGQHYPAHRLPLGGPQGDGALPVEGRHRAEGVNGDADDGGQDHDAEDDSRGQER